MSEPIYPRAHIVADRLSGLLPELQFSRETHVQWSEATEAALAANPSIGDSAFHLKCIVEYDERINAIREAILCLRELELANQQLHTHGTSLYREVNELKASQAHRLGGMT